MIQITCQCGKILYICDDTLSGVAVSCSRCGSVFRLTFEEHPVSGEDFSQSEKLQEDEK